MYIEKIRINKFRVLEDIEVHFQPPNGTTASPENGNVVNVIAGVNGTGKTSLLEAIFLAASNPYQVRDKIEALTLQGLPVKETSPRFIFSTSQMHFQYQEVQRLNSAYQSFQRINNRTILGNAEFYIKNLILTQERSSKLADPEARTAQAVNAFNAVFEQTSLLTRLVDLDSRQFNRPVFKNMTGQLVTIDQLSDGEKQLYGRVIALMILEPHNSVILIDEPEIALHPAWQQQIMKIYARIGTNNQFIVATHSPQVIRSVPYQNRIILSKQDGRIMPVYFHNPPSGIDINSILSEVMGADPVPQDVQDIQRRYRELVEQNQEQTEQALSLKQQLLTYEGEHSQFMQEMNFLIELRDAA